MNLRTIKNEKIAWEENQCLEYLAKRLGCNIDRISKRIKQLAEICGKQANKRKLPEGEEAYWWCHEWEALSRILLRLVSPKPDLD
jgi:hypothetical protein